MKKLVETEQDLLLELEARGTAEVTDGVVNQVTQALKESETEVEFLIFGELQKQSIIPIGKACARCNHCHFDTYKECQDRQKKAAKARGFTQVVCPEQFVGDAR